MLRQTLFRTTAIGIGTTVMGISQWGREIGVNSKYSTGNWEFSAKEQIRGQ